MASGQGWRGLADAGHALDAPGRNGLAHGRGLAAWLGLAPRQATTGGTPKLLGISKRGNGCLRKRLVHGARAALRMPSGTDTATGRWLRGLPQRAHRNTVVVALAAKLARAACAVLRRGRGFADAAAAAPQDTGSAACAGPAWAADEVCGWRT